MVGVVADQHGVAQQPGQPLEALVQSAESAARARRDGIARSRRQIKVVGVIVAHMLALRAAVIPIGSGQHPRQDATDLVGLAGGPSL